MKLSSFEEVAALVGPAAMVSLLTPSTLAVAVATKMVPDPMQNPTHDYTSIQCAIGYIISNSYSAEKPKGMR
jgi:hypothetical protein